MGNRAVQKNFGVRWQALKRDTAFDVCSVPEKRCRAQALATAVQKTRAALRSPADLGIFPFVEQSPQSVCSGEIFWIRAWGAATISRNLPTGKYAPALAMSRFPFLHWLVPGFLAFTPLLRAGSNTELLYLSDSAGSLTPAFSSSVTSYTQTHDLADIVLWPR